MFSRANELDALFDRFRRTPSDINEHLDILYLLAHKATGVVEFGTRHGVSTIALLAARPDFLECYDLDRKPEVDRLERLALENEITFRFYLEDIGKLKGKDFPKNVSLLFLDSLHTYDHVLYELTEFHDYVRNYIILHDVVSFGQKGVVAGSKGLVPAITEFLYEYDNWEPLLFRENNHGLLVLERTR